MSNNEQFFDSHTVDEYYGKFSGTIFDLDDVAKHFKFDDLISFIVTARVDSSVFGMTKNGEIKRTNTFKVNQVSPILDAGEPIESELLLSDQAVVADDKVDGFQQSFMFEPESRPNTPRNASAKLLTGGERYLDQRLKNTEYRQEYNQAVVVLNNDEDIEEEEDLEPVSIIRNKKDSVLQKFLEVG